MAAIRTYLQTAIDTTGLSEYTFATQNFGSAAADRHLIAVVYTRDTGTGAKSLSAITIGGVTATIVAQAQGTVTGTNSCMVAIAVAPVPSGTAGDVVVTWSEAVLRCGLTLYRGVGLSATPHDTASSVTTDPAVTLDIPADGFAIGGWAGANAVAWSGLTEDVDQDIGASRLSAASAEFASEEDARAIAVSESGGIDPVLVCVSFGPAAAGATYDDTLTLTASAGLTSASQAVLGGALALAVQAAADALSEVGEQARGPITVWVGGVDRTVYVDADQPLRWSDQVDGRGTLSVTFADAVGGWAPEDGQEVLVLEGSVRRFGGRIIEPEEQLAGDLLFYRCMAVEFSALCDQHVIARAYTEQTLRDIVLDIILQDMAEEGIDTSGVETGPTIKKAIFNWVTVTDAFNQLAELSGMTWRIDENKVLQFRERSSIAAPSVLTSATVRQGTVRIRPDRQHYRNRQVLRAGAGLTDPRVETFVGDGARQTFNVAFKIGTVPTITVNDVAQTVGIRQLETGKDWYWNKGASEISQDTGATALSSSDVLSVTYQGLFPIIVAASRGSEILARQAIEGGSGRYARVEERSNIETVEAAQAAVQAMLDRYGTIARVLTCQTDSPGFAPGQLVSVSFDAHGLEDEFLIEAVDAEVPPGLDEIWYTLRAISGDPYGGWQEYFRRLMRIGRQFVINENEVVVGLQALSDGATASDDLDVTEDSPPARLVDSARVGFSAVRAA